MFLPHFANYLFFFREEFSVWLSFVISFYSHRSYEVVLSVLNLVFLKFKAILDAKEYD